MWKIPILSANSQRIVLWGCTVNERVISAELFYLDVQLPKSIWITDREGKHSYLVEIPEGLQGQIFPRKGQRIELGIIS